MAFQYPVEIPGIANSSFFKNCYKFYKKKIIIEPVNTKIFRRVNEIAINWGLINLFFQET